MTLAFGVSTQQLQGLSAALEQLAVVAAERPGSDLVFDDSGAISVAGTTDPVSLNGIIEDIGTVSMTMEIGGFYDEVGGKFSKVIGNVAIVDCNYFADSLFPAMKQAIFPLILIDRQKYFTYLAVLNAL